MLNIVWLKRDLRLFDHEPIFRAIDSKHPTLFTFIIEPSLWNAQDYSPRHWQFMRDCLKDMQKGIGSRHKEVLYILHGEVLQILEEFRISNTKISLYSHQETGNNLTFNRDKQVLNWCRKNNIEWHEFKQNGVVRGIKSRKNWNKQWSHFMNSPILDIPLKELKIARIHSELKEKFNPEIPLSTETSIQSGGSSQALKALNSFLNIRMKNYTAHISKPIESRKSCSRLSPHISWGSISIRYVYQQICLSNFSFNKKNFLSRLHWHCHFIQKLESDPRIEFFNQNSAYNNIRNEFNLEYFKRFKEGKTGIPMIDASIRCLNKTGYINFRLRAMLVSFWTHILWQPWNKISTYLARQFTDYEPGIHYAQIQMQASTVGYHTIRIYNPIKLAIDHDPESLFIKKWVPELSNLPKDLCYEPWKINSMEELFFNFKLKSDYVEPIVDISLGMKKASKTLHEIKNLNESRKIANELIHRHVNKKNRAQ